MRYFIHLAYNGTPYHGWQIQPNADSVQQTLEYTLGKLCGEELNIVLQTPTELQRLGKKERNTILKQLCEYGANIRQISRVTGISYGVIYRAKSGS